MLETKIIANEVGFIIEVHKTCKTSGRDCFAAKFYKTLKRELIILLSSVFNQILKKGKVLDLWNNSEIIVCLVF